MSNKIVTSLRRPACPCGSDKRVHLIDKETLEFYCETCERHHKNPDMLVHMSPVLAPDDADEQLRDYQQPWIMNRLGKIVSMRLTPRDLKLLSEAMQHYKTTSPAFALSEMLHELLKVGDRPDDEPKPAAPEPADDGVIRL